MADFPDFPRSPHASEPPSRSTEGSTPETRQSGDATRAPLVESGTLRDLAGQSSMRVIEKLLDRIAAFSDHQHEAVTVMHDMIEGVIPIERPEAMIALSTLVPSLPAPADPLYDRIFGEMQRAHDAHEQWKQLRLPLAERTRPSAEHDSQPSAPYQIDDHAYSGVLTNRIRAIAKVDPRRHPRETQNVFKEIALLEPALQVAPLKVMAEELGNLDEKAVTPALFNAILGASLRIIDADTSGTTAYDGIDVLPPLS